MSQGKSRSESYRFIANDVERTVRSLVPNDFEWTLGQSGRTTVADFDVVEG